MLERTVDVAIIGAGTAGLNAMAQVRRAGKSFVLINGGELGTTCARVGCMPSKAFIQIAEDYHRRHIFDRHAIEGSEHLNVDHADAMEHVRDIRDILVDRVLGNSTDEMGEELLEDTYATFTAPGVIQAGDTTVHYNKAVIATGSAPIVPSAWQALGDKVITTDDFFELEHLPESMAVIGLGVIGLELGQALHAIGVEVTGFDMADKLANLSDSNVANPAYAILSKEFPLHLGHPAELSEEDGKVRVTAGENSVLVDKVLVAMGRRPNIDGLGLENLSLPLNEKGLPEFNPNTMQVGDSSIFVAGDMNGDLQILHEAGDEGRIAGYNASHDEVVAFKRKVPLGITFSDPNICQVGATWDQLQGSPNVVAGEMPLGPVGRALIMAKNKGIIRLYADKTTGLLLGAAMVSTKGENLSHLIAWAIEQEMTVQQLLRMPFYHPTIEEAFQAALYNIYSKLELDDAEKLLELSELTP